MKKLIITAAALIIAATAYGQGQFQFTTRDTSAGIDLRVKDSGGAYVSGSGYFIEVLAGTSEANLAPLTPLLGEFRSGTGAGWPNPFGATYSAPGATMIGVRAFKGTSWATATETSALLTFTKMLSSGAQVNIALPTDPTAPPPEIYLGTASLTLVATPEPTTLALGALGLGSLLLFRRRK
jgi:hypothetical protein